MAAPRPERRAAMRALFERYNVPSELIATVAGYLTETVEQYTCNQSHVVESPVSEIRTRLIGKIDTLVARLASAESNPGDDEKLARTLTHLLKSMEQMNGLEALTHGPKENETDEPDFSLGLAGGPDHTSELDRRLASLVADAARQQDT